AQRLRSTAGSRNTIAHGVWVHLYFVGAGAACDLLIATSKDRSLRQLLRGIFVCQRTAVVFH
ncbi:hypothetical protein, partial [Pseudomonas endophytica]|uniref:hypothetical protein n=1 Tax=Pseudomonas endophytica TaxID=1563157 RepID=UPI0019D3CB11